MPKSACRALPADAYLARHALAGCTTRRRSANSSRSVPCFCVSELGQRQRKLVHLLPFRIEPRSVRHRRCVGVPDFSRAFESDCQGRDRCAVRGRRYTAARCWDFGRQGSACAWRRFADGGHGEVADTEDFVGQGRGADFQCVEFGF